MTTVPGMATAIDPAVIAVVRVTGASTTIATVIVNGQTVSVSESELNVNVRSGTVRSGTAQSGTVRSVRSALGGRSVKNVLLDASASWQML